MQFRMKDFHQKNKLNMRPFVIGSLHEAEVQNYQQAHANHSDLQLPIFKSINH